MTKRSIPPPLPDSLSIKRYEVHIVLDRKSRYFDEQLKTPISQLKLSFFRQLFTRDSLGSRLLVRFTDPSTTYLCPLRCPNLTLDVTPPPGDSISCSSSFSFIILLTYPPLHFHPTPGSPRRRRVECFLGAYAEGATILEQSVADLDFPVSRCGGRQ